MIRVLCLSALAFGICWFIWGGQPPQAKKPQPRAAKQKSSKLYFDGKLVKVHWSDGDTFRILEGKQRGLKARLKGFNTLESYGPVHRWGKWTGRELAKNADQATAAVRRGTWRCTRRGKRDRYNRALVACPDLARHLVAKGLAHIFGTPKGKDIGLIALQAKAIKAKAGMWAKGAPSHLLTSVHSSDEGKRAPYNRLVSTKDGSFQIIHHKKRYNTCQWVCVKGACLLYVPYKRRYGWNKARCLR